MSRWMLTKGEKMSVLPKIHKKEDIELLRKMYIDEKMSTVDIEINSKKIFGFFISRGTIYKEMIKHKILVRNKSDSISMATCTLDINKSFLNEDLIEWIDGFNLGDGYIHFDKSRRDCLGAKFCFGSVQQEWASFAMSKLKCYGAKEPKVLTKILDKKHPHPTWSSSTLTHPDIVEQAKRWYPNGKKIVPLDVRITPTSLLLWYLGDGSISKMGVSFFIRLATCGFTPEDVENILIPKLSVLGLNVGRHIFKNDIRISGDSLKKFFDIIGHKSPIKCYNYKFEYGEWLNLHRLKDVVKNNQEKWRVQYMFKQGKLDCSTSPGGKLIMFTDEQKNKIREILDGHILHDDYKEPIIEKPSEENIRISDIIKNDTERWNARYLVTRKVIQSNKSMVTKEQAELLRVKLDTYGDKSAIPDYKIDCEFRKYRELGFPYYKYNNEELVKKVNQISKFEPILEDGLYKWSGFGTELANYFHPQMFECRKKDKMSPIEFFNSDIDFKRGIKKIIALYPEITKSHVREICCNETASSRINNFPPRVMITILNHLYNGQKITMLDPCSGFSGRLLGGYCSGIVKKYIGMDLSEKTYDGLIQTKEFLNNLNNSFQVDIIKGNCLEILPTINENVDFVFTSPPFLDEEEYIGVSVEKNYEMWKKLFIRPFIEKSYSVLRSGGKFSVYAEAIRRNNFPFDFCNIASEVGFKRLDDINFKMASRENLRKSSTHRVVKVVVFEK